MKKLLEKWCKLKSLLIFKQKAEIYFYEREVWWARIGLNIGVENNGKGPEFTRPVIILRKFNKKSAHVIPLTTVCDKHKLVNGHIFEIGCVQGKRAYAILSQSKTIDSKRLVRKLQVLPKKTFESLVRKYVEYMFGKYI